MPRGDNNRKLSDEQRDEIVSRYTHRLPDGTWLGVPTLAREFGVSNYTVQLLLKKRGVQTRSRQEARANGKRCKPIKNLPVGSPPSCKCGCGQPTEWNRRKNRWNVYAFGHYTRRGSQGPSWRGGVSLAPYSWDWHYTSRRIRRRDGQTCQECGRKFPERHPDLHVHHKDGSKTNNAWSNLISLCRGCHTAAHNRLRSRQGRSSVWP